MNDQTKKNIRKPVQARSIDRKDKILDAAMELICEKGYYNTTTNEIAKKAQVSIGSLYSYFEDKEKIFFEILDRYHDRFTKAKIGIIDQPELVLNDTRYYIRELLLHLIQVHEESKEFNRELEILAYYNPKIAEVLERNKENTMKDTVGNLLHIKDKVKLKDLEASIAVMYDMLSATVDRIVFGNGKIDRERLIDAAVDAVDKYFFL